MSSVNKVILIGNVGKEPEIRTMQSGSKICNMSIATSEKWKDKATGERKENTQWHRVVVFNEPLVNVIEKYVSKGSKVFIEGQLETRKWTGEDGKDNYSTEVVLRPYKGELTILDSKKNSDDDHQGQRQEPKQQATSDYAADLDDDIPFN